MDKEKLKLSINELERLNDLKYKLDELEDEIKILKNEYNSIKAINFNGISAKNNKVSVVEQIVINKEEKLLNLYREKAKLELEIRIIERKLEKLNEKYKVILEGRYGQKKKTWKQLAIQLNYSESYCRNKLIYAALMKLEKILVGA